MAQNGKHLSPSQLRRGEERKPKQEAHRLASMDKASIPPGIPESPPENPVVIPSGTVPRSKFASFEKWLLSTPSSNTPDWAHRFLLFIEHPLTILFAGIIGGVVGLIFPPLFYLCGVSVILALHRSQALKNTSRATQMIAYAFLSVVLMFGLANLNTAIQQKLADNNTSFAQRVAVLVGAMLKSK